jgi:hypothetical protein
MKKSKIPKRLFPGAVRWDRKVSDKKKGWVEKSYWDSEAKCVRTCMVRIPRQDCC